MFIFMKLVGGGKISLNVKHFSKNFNDNLKL